MLLHAGRQSEVLSVLRVSHIPAMHIERKKTQPHENTHKHIHTHTHTDFKASAKASMALAGIDVST
jgi:hypothetical protein